MAKAYQSIWPRETHGTSAVLESGTRYGVRTWERASGMDAPGESSGIAERANQIALKKRMALLLGLTSNEVVEVITSANRIRELRVA